jgi:hypothetical protein
MAFNCVSQGKGVCVLYACMLLGKGTCNKWVLMKCLDTMETFFNLGVELRDQLAHPN